LLCKKKKSSTLIFKEVTTLLYLRYQYFSNTLTNSALDNTHSKKYDNFKMFVIVKPIKQTKISLKLKCYFEIKKILKYIYADRFIFFTLVLLNMFQKELKWNCVKHTVYITMRYINIKALVIYKRYSLYKMQFHSDSTVRPVQKIKYTVLWHKECIHWENTWDHFGEKICIFHSLLKMSIFSSTSANNMLSD